MNNYKVSHIDSLGSDFVSVMAESASEAARTYIANMDNNSSRFTPTTKALVTVEDITTKEVFKFEVNADVQVSYWVTEVKN